MKVQIFLDCHEEFYIKSTIISKLDFIRKNTLDVGCGIFEIAFELYYIWNFLPFHMEL